MKKQLRTVTFTLACLLLMASLAACGSLSDLAGRLTGGFDATLYIRGTLDKIYLAKYSDDYLSMVDSTKSEAEKDYQAGIDSEYAYVVDRFEIDDDYITDESRETLKQLLRDIYQHSKYEVDTATKAQDEYSIKVTVYPITIFYDIMENDYEAYAGEFNTMFDAMDEDAFDSMSEAEQEAFWEEYEETWVQGIIGLIRARTGEITYAEPVVELVRVYPEGDVYTISDEDMSDIDWLVLKY